MGFVESEIEEESEDKEDESMNLSFSPQLRRKFNLLGTLRLPTMSN